MPAYFQDYSLWRGWVSMKRERNIKKEKEREDI